MATTGGGTRGSGLVTSRDRGRNSRITRNACRRCRRGDTPTRARVDRRRRRATERERNARPLNIDMVATKVVNANPGKHDAFGSPVIERSTQTRFGVFLSLVVVPLLLAMYSALWFVEFYVGLGPASPPLYKVITTEQLQFGNQIKPLALKCSNPDGCFFRLPQNAVNICSSSSGLGLDAGESSDLCNAPSATPGPAPGPGPSTPGPAPVPGPVGGAPINGRRLLQSSFYDAINPGRQLLQDSVTPASCTDKIECDTELSAAEGVCAFSPPGADPTDALTVQWKWTEGCSGGCNFGVKLITDYIDSKGEVTQKEIKVHRGIALMNLIERDDPRLKWSTSHPNYAANKKKTTMYEWSITTVDIDGVVDEVSNLCTSSLAGEFGCTNGNAVSTANNGYTCGAASVNAKRVKLVPAPTYTKMTTTYPSPGLTYLSAIGGISSVIYMLLGYVHRFHLKVFGGSASEDAPVDA